MTNFAPLFPCCRWRVRRSWFQILTAVSLQLLSVWSWLVEPSLHLLSESDGEGDRKRERERERGLTRSCKHRTVEDRSSIINPPRHTHTRGCMHTLILQQSPHASINLLKIQISLIRENKYQNLGKITQISIPSDRTIFHAHRGTLIGEAWQATG